MIYVHLQVVAILCTGYHVFFGGGGGVNVKLPRIVNVYVLMHGSWEFSYQGLKIRDYVCDHVNLNEGTLK